VAKEVFLQRSTLTSNDLTYRIMEKVFGDRGGSRKMDPSVVFGKPHQAIYKLNREPFVSVAAAGTVKLVQERTYNLISFSHSLIDQNVWERAANVTTDAHGTSAEASLFPLIRNFVGDLACTVLMGQDFMTNNPNILSDLWTLDAAFNKLIIGFPWWFPGMAPAYNARRRIHRAVFDFHRALQAVREDQDPGPGWNDVSDVSQVMQERATIFHELGFDTHLACVSDGTIIWAMNVNANQLIFWTLWYIYQHADLQAEILSEIKPYASLTPVPSDLPIKEPPKLRLELDGLLHKCPLFKATFYETMRFKSPSTSYRSVRGSFHVTESSHDAGLDGKMQPQSYRFKEGEYICIAHGVHNRDGRYFPDPATFNPRRFFVVSDDEQDAGQVRVDMGSMKPFGGGASMCKGRHFAEREVLTVVAAILTGWEMEPVGGRWMDPGRIMGSGAYVPKKDVRVKLRRRVVAS
jgi:cytochrome P450